ncbi:NAD-dependent protein deacetylase [Paraliobacillus sp. PM-2]|uniref:NAD-dependent protein deacylase n=1 Tax=Paraliobacillus sp. PM-2 TaxID=1462524 RepID=UPI00061BDEBD|nr:NAD-dependent protein deacylase [Paraliobacillus sp. PM-2]CQR46034.1 NAD-dependent protein deacetylase [Paraliobacillus sp. PM-2]
MSQAEELAVMMKNSNRITFLTGAGVSTASGIPDFRSTNGLWTEDKSREYYMSRQYFMKNPEDFWHKYKEIFRVKILKNYQPNKVHLFLKALEDQGKDITIITQNVDGLHGHAGNQHVLEYHGNLNTATCPMCQTTYELDYLLHSYVPLCNQNGCGDVLKPDIVLFGDPITLHEQAVYAIRQSDLVVVLGTSLMVTPFSLLPYTAAEMKIPIALINRDATPMDGLFNWIIHDDLLNTMEKIKGTM